MKRICFWLVVCLLLSVCSAFADGTAEVSALLEQAQSAFEVGDYETAVPLLQEAAEKGDATAQNWLGTCYSAGIVVEQDNEQAAMCYRLAADQGNIPAIYNLASCYLNGDGVEQDAQKAEELLRTCADQGDAESQYALG